MSEKHAKVHSKEVCVSRWFRCDCRGNTVLSSAGRGSQSHHYHHHLQAFILLCWKVGGFRPGVLIFLVPKGSVFTAGIPRLEPIPELMPEPKEPASNITLQSFLCTPPSASVLLSFVLWTRSSLICLCKKYILPNCKTSYKLLKIKLKSCHSRFNLLYKQHLHLTIVQSQHIVPL